MMPKLIVKEIWQAKNCGNLPFVEEDDSKVAYDYNKGNNIEDGIVHDCKVTLKCNRKGI